jgi:hypothetical protein
VAVSAWRSDDELLALHFSHALHLGETHHLTCAETVRSGHRDAGGLVADDAGDVLRGFDLIARVNAEAGGGMTMCEGMSPWKGVEMSSLPGDLKASPRREVTMV